MEKTITRENITAHLLTYQLEMVGKSIMDVIDDDHWRFTITLTNKQKTEFRQYAIKLIKKTFKCNTGKADETFDWFYKSFGCRIKN